jgi:hypothetical protein
MALSATFYLELQFLHKSSVRRIQFRQWPTCHFTKRPFGTGCDNIRNVPRRSKNENPERTGFAFSNICYLKVQKISSVENGLKL